MSKTIKYGDYTIRPLKNEGEFRIDKVTEPNGDIFYDVYDEEDNLQNVFRNIKDARRWARMMSE